MKLIVLVIILMLTLLRYYGVNSIGNNEIIDINEDAGNSDINVDSTEYNDYDNVRNIIYTSNVNRSYEKLPSLPKLLKKGIYHHHLLLLIIIFFYFLSLTLII